MVARILSVAFLLLMGVTGLTAPIPALDDERNIPEEWYRSPEEGLPSSPRDSSRLKAKFYRNLGDFLQADGESLDQLPDFPSKATPEGKISHWVPWHLFALGTELGISAKGILAPLGIKGSADIEVYWQKKRTSRQNQFQPSLADETTSEPVTLELNPDSRFEDVLPQLEPGIRGAMATGRIKDERALRKNLYKAALEFFELSRVIDSPQGYPWFVGRYRLDITIDGQGLVHPGIAVGAEVRLRFEWHRLMQKTKGGRDDLPKEKWTLEQKKFAQFVRDLVEDTEVIGRESFAKGGFVPKWLWFSLGVTAEGNFGVVKAGGGPTGTLYLYPDLNAWRSRPLIDRTRALNRRPLLLIEENPPTAHLEYAKSQGVIYQTEANQRGVILRAIFHLNRKHFVKGLKKAAQLGHRITEKAREIHLRKWYPHEVRITFQLSLGADLTLVSVYATGGVQLGMFRPDFNGGS
jgi:hypothetical protein